MFNGDNIELTLQKAILTLPAKQRAVFQMRYYDEISFAEIAEITKTSEGALKASYHIAAQKIEDYIKTHDN
jgi:RNA polymerase sigma-70 factor (ECF subfamily)